MSALSAICWVVTSSTPRAAKSFAAAAVMRSSLCLLVPLTPSEVAGRRLAALVWIRLACKRLHEHTQVMTRDERAARSAGEELDGDRSELLVELEDAAVARSRGR